MDIKIEDIINKALREKQAERPTKIQTSWYISGLGGCLRGEYFSRLGNKPDYPIDDRMLRVFNVGNKTESWLVELLKSQNDILKIETQIRVENKELNISGYVDAILEFRDEKVLYEFKSKHSRSFWYMKKSGAQRAHQYQLWTYLYLLNLPRGKLVYVSKDDLSIMEFEIRLDDKELHSEVISIVNILNRAWESKNPLLLPLPEKDSWQAKYCSFHKQCLKAEYNKSMNK